MWPAFVFLAFVFIVSYVVFFGRFAVGLVRKAKSLDWYLHRLASGLPPKFICRDKDYLIIDGIAIKWAAMLGFLLLILCILGIAIVITGPAWVTGVLDIVAAIIAGIPFLLYVVAEVINRQLIRAVVDFTLLGVLMYFYVVAFSMDISAVAKALDWPVIDVIVCCGTLNLFRTVVWIMTS